MARLRAGLLFLCLWLLAGPAAAEERGSYRVLDFVDPLIGTTNGGWFAILPSCYSAAAL